MIGLEKHAETIRKDMKASATGPLRVSFLVCEELEPVWDDEFKQAADGKRLTSWLTGVTGNKGHGLQFFRRRYNAVKLICDECRTWVDHSLAVWLVGQTQDADTIQRVYLAWRNIYRDNGNIVLAPEQGKRIAGPILGKSVNKKVDSERVYVARIKQLENELNRNGINVPPWIRVAV